MGVLDNDQSTYSAYDLRVQGLWDDLTARVVLASRQHVDLPFTFIAYRADAIAAKVELATFLDVQLWISDDDYTAMRASHAKCNAYNDALQKAVDKAFDGPNTFPKAPPDGTTIPPPPETLGDTLGGGLTGAGDAAEKAAEGFGKAALIGAGVIVGGVILFKLLSPGKKGDQ